MVFPYGIVIPPYFAIVMLSMGLVMTIIVATLHSPARTSSVIRRWMWLAVATVGIPSLSLAAFTLFGPGAKVVAWNEDSLKEQVLTVYGGEVKHTITSEDFRAPYTGGMATTMPTFYVEFPGEGLTTCTVAFQEPQGDEVRGDLYCGPEGHLTPRPTKEA